jgi:hypothetical protein
MIKLGLLVGIWSLFDWNLNTKLQRLDVSSRFLLFKKPQRTLLALSQFWFDTGFGLFWFDGNN